MSRAGGTMEPIAGLLIPDYPYGSVFHARSRGLAVSPRVLGPGSLVVDRGPPHYGTLAALKTT
eukprot:scaffold229108_cov27-Prasinocladus_malaysianus.AAC.1